MQVSQVPSGSLAPLWIMNDSFWRTAQMLRENDSLCDVCLSTTDTDSGAEVVYPAHRVILAGRSSFFEESFTSPDNMDVFKFEDVDPQTLKTLVDFIYLRVSVATIMKDEAALKLAQLLQIRGLDMSTAKDTSGQHKGARGTVVPHEVIEEIIKERKETKKKEKPVICSPETPSPSKIPAATLAAWPYQRDPHLSSTAIATADHLDNVPIKMESEEGYTSDALSPIQLELQECSATVEACDEMSSVLDGSVDDFTDQTEPDLSEDCDRTQKDLASDEAGLKHLHSGLSKHAFQCQVCAVVKSSINDLRQHLRTMHNIRQASYICTKCDTAFKYKRNYFSHLSSIHSEKPYTCDSCPAKFGSSEGLYHHTCTKHKELTPQNCELCFKAFKLPAQLQAHLRYTHQQGGGPETCQLCGREFKQLSSLNRHLRTFHSQVRNYPCPVCSSRFKTNDDMRKHLRLHYQPEKLKSRKHPPGEDYPCRYCHKIFKNYTYRKSHENLMHESRSSNVHFACSQCTKSFRNEHYLRLHQNNVHRPKRFHCSRCQRQYAFKYELNRHLPRCKGFPNCLKPFTCEFCQMKFTLKGNLTKHQNHGRCRLPRQEYQFLVVTEEEGKTDTADFHDESDLPVWAVSKPGSEVITHLEVTATPVDLTDAYMDTTGT